MAYVRVNEKIRSELWELKYELKARSINEVIQELIEFYEQGKEGAQND